MATSFWREKIKIGTLEVPRFIGGPLDGITDSPFRRLVRQFSRDELLFGEMRHVSFIAHAKQGANSLRFCQSERPFNFQVSANQVTAIEEACERIVAAGVDAVDLNIGCPAKNVIRSGSGSALMGDVPRLEQILLRFRAALPIPFTVKMRSGFKQVNAIEVAKLAEQCGADAITVHPRLQTQRFEGRPNYGLVAEVKAAVSIPVLVSGGVVNWATAKMVREQTNCDGFLIGRGIWGRPWKLRELQAHAAGEDFTVDGAMILDSALAQLHAMCDYYGEHGLYAFRKHLPFYLRGKPNASQVRERAVRANTVTEVEGALRTFWEE